MEVARRGFSVLVSFAIVTSTVIAAALTVLLGLSTHAQHCQRRWANLKTSQWSSSMLNPAGDTPFDAAPFGT